MTTADLSYVRFPLPESPSLFHPAPESRELQEHRPVAPVRFPDGKTAWLVTRYPNVRRVLIDPSFSRAHPLAASFDGGLGELTSGTMFGMDPPQHTRLRRLVAREFTAGRIEDLRPRVIEIIDELLQRMRHLEQPADLVENFAVPLPVRVICDLIGVPPADQDRFHQWSTAILGSLERDSETMMAGFASLYEYFGGLIDAKRARPDDDLMSALVAARDSDDRLSEDELVVLGISLLVAGHETIANQIVMILLTLRAYPDQRAKLQVDPAAAVEELMRFIQIGTSMTALTRVTTEAVELSGVTIPAGQAVLPAVGIANRDPRVFAQPDRLDLGRDASGHLTFGSGVHHCLGAQLARMELQEALSGLLRWLPGLQIAIDDADLVFKPTMIVRSVERLPVTWDTG